MATTLTGIPRAVDKGSGGIKRVWLALSSDVTNVVVAAETGVLTFAATAAAFKEYVFGKESASNFTETVTGNVANGSLSVGQVLTLIFKKNETTKRKEIQLLAHNELVAIVEDNNGYVVMLGATRGLDLTQNATATGNLFADANHNQVTLTGLEPTMAPEVASADYTKIIAGTAIPGV